MLNNQKLNEYTCSNCNHIFKIVKDTDVTMCPICHTVSILTINNRKHPRKLCNITSDIILSTGVKLQGIVEDISLHGYRFKLLKNKLNSLLNIDDVVTIEYTLPNSKLGVTITDIIKIVHFLEDEKFYGAVVVDPVDYSFNIRKKGFWLMEIDNVIRLS